MLHSLNSFVICVILYNFTPICLSNLLTYCMEKEDLTGIEFCEISPNASFLTVAEEKGRKGVFELGLITSMSGCDFNHITVQLDINNTTDEKACMVVDKKLRTHSYAEYEFESEESCAKSNFSFEMDHIYTGCYIMTFGLHKKNGSHKITAEPLVFNKWISNNYTAENFQLEKPKTTLKHSRNGTEINIYFDTDMITKWDYSLELFDSTSETIDIAEDDVTSYSFPMDVKGNCTITAVVPEKMTCIFQELPSGNYELIFKLEDVPWCVYRHGVFANKCSWTANFEHHHMEPRNETALQVQSWPQIGWVHSVLIGLLCLVMLVMLVLLYVSLRKRYSRKKIIVTHWKNTLANVVQDDEITSEVECRERVSGILLLYARDCQPFMQAMEHFREFLQAETGLEVYDLFDYTRFDEISRSPNEWIQGVLEDCHIKSVLVGTPCGDLVYNNLIRHFARPDEEEHSTIPMCSLYKNPEFLDGVVLHAIKMVSLDVYHRLPYLKYFVSYIPNFSSDNTLSQINPFKRYALPDAASRLVADLRPAPSPLAAPRPPHALQQLQHSLARLADYVTSHPHYLHAELLKER